MPPDLLARYQPWRRWAEAGFWVLVLGLQVAANTTVLWIDLAREGAGVPLWQPFALELSSNLVMGALVPVVLLGDRRFPLGWATWRRHLPVHALLTVPFCAAHVAGMVALRKLVFGAAGLAYPVDWGSQFFYEYLKDVRTYALILLAFWSYRQLLLRLQGEARLLDPPEPPAGAPPAPAPPEPQRPERFLVRKLRKEFLVAAADIEWLQAQGNYVGLHVQGHDYLLRSTLTDFLQQLDPARFARVHRSYAVNLDCVAEIEPLESGDARLKMKGGQFVPCSRRYRDALAGPPAA